MNCPNCQSQLSCGCQKRKASDGNDVCTNCLAFYEAQVSSGSTPIELKTTIPNPTESTPSNVKVKYIPPPRIGNT